MKVEINWTPGPPTKVGKCLLAIRGSEDAIPAVLSTEGRLYSQVTPAATYDPDTIAYHAAWPQYPRERDERWIECDMRTYEDWSKGGLLEETVQLFRDGDWPSIREYFDPQQENQKP